MEYTKDMVFKVRYDDVNRVSCFKTKNRTSRFFRKIKEHKLITVCVLLALFFMIIDGLLITNFLNILETL